jgi:hypothetical protein
MTDDYNPNHTHLSDEEREKMFSQIDRFIRVAGKQLKESSMAIAKVRSEYDERIQKISESIEPFALFVDALDKTEVKPLPLTSGEYETNNTEHME